MTKQKAVKYLFCFAIVALLGFYGFILFYHLGSRPFVDWDESIYAQVAKEALQNHHYLSFTYFGQNWFEKPPLMIWLTALGFKLLGLTELGGRFFVASFAFATLILNFVFAKKVTKSFFAAFLTLLCYGICFQFFFHSYFLEFDIPVSFFILLGIYSFLLALEKPKYFYLFFAALALGTLTKSVIGLIPVPIILIYCLITRQWKQFNTKHFYRGIGLYLLLVLPWHIWETIKFGKNFWGVYLLYHVLARYATPLENNGGGFGFYLPILSQNGLFAIFTLASSIYFVFKIRKNHNYLIVFLSTVFIFLFFSFAQTKGYGYMVVIYPFLLTMFGAGTKDLLCAKNYLGLQITAVAILATVCLSAAWQEEKFKILRLENNAEYDENKDIAKFIKTNYPNTTVYVGSRVEGNLAFYYYLEKVTSLLPKNTTLPQGFREIPQYRVFHRLNRSVYHINNYLYIAP